MTEVTKELVDKLAVLCRIACSDRENEKLQDDLRKILTHVEQLDQIPTEGVEECCNVLGMVNVERADEANAELDRKPFLANATDQAGGYIRVPPVIHKKKH